MRPRSARSGEEWARLKGSLFTHHLLAGMRGLADKDGDGAVSLSETYAYVFNNTVSQSVVSRLGVQRPTFEMKLQGWGDWVVASPRELGARIVLPAELSGRLWVIDEGNEVIAELQKAGGEAAAVAVTPGRYPGGGVEGAFSRWPT